MIPGRFQVNSHSRTRPSRFSSRNIKKLGTRLQSSLHNLITISCSPSHHPQVQKQHKQLLICWRPMLQALDLLSKQFSNLQTLQSSNYQNLSWRSLLSKVHVCMYECLEAITSWMLEKSLCASTRARIYEYVHVWSVATIHVLATPQYGRRTAAHDGLIVDFY